MGMRRKALLLLSLGLLFLSQAGGICWSQTTERVSVDTAGVEGDGPSFAPSITADGRYVAFESDATNLAGAVTDTNGWSDIFLRDRQTATTIRVSIHSDGTTQGNNRSNSPSISGDGRYVAFESWATNLVATGGDAFPDIFVHNRQSATTTRVSVDSAGDEQVGESLSPSISGDGRYVAFQSNADLVIADSGLFTDIFVRDLLAAKTTRVSVASDGSEGSGHSYSPSISGDGRYVAFESNATDLVPGDLLGFIDIFVHDRDADGNGTYDEPGGISTVRVSVDSAGNEANSDSSAPSISADGRYVAFASNASNLVAGDTNGRVDIFVRNLLAGTTTRVSVDSTGIQGNGDSRSPSVSADGRSVAFDSDASNLVAGDTNVSADAFVHDRQTGITERVSVDSTGIQGNGDSRSPSVSADGKYLAFESDSDNLVASDGNGFFDIFTYEWESLAPTVDSTSPADSANGVAVGSSITATFSEPMNGSTIDTNTFTLDNGVTGTVTYDANSTTARFTPTSNLDYDTTYIATITNAAEDLAGNPMLADHTWSFTTKSEQKNSGGSGPCFIATAASDRSS